MNLSVTTVMNSTASEDAGMEEVVKIVLIIAGSAGGILAIIMAAILCTCCFKRRKNQDSDREAITSSKYSPVEEHDGITNTHALENRGNSLSDSPGYKWSRQRSTSSEKVGKKTIKFERDPEKRLITEHVQPSASSSMSLNQSLGFNRTPEAYHYQATNDTQSLRSGSESPAKGAADTSLWKDVQKFTSKLLVDGEVEEPPVTTQEDEVDGVDCKLGKLQFCVGYDFPTSTLTIKVFRAIGLPAKDLSGTSDPYVRIMLLPDKKHKFMTKIKKKNLSPRWNETFAYEGWPHNKLLEKTLYLQVIDYDRFSRDDPMGETYVPLNEIDLSLFPTMWKYLQPCKDSRGKLGELLLSLCYQPTVGRLTVVVMKAKDLKAKDVMGLSDPYVKFWLCQGGRKLEKQKTQIHFSNLNPVFNETFNFDIPWEKIRETTLDVSIMDFDRIGRNDLIGKFTLGARSGPMETKHWNDMLGKPRQQVAQWHLLKD